MSFGLETASPSGRLSPPLSHKYRDYAITLSRAGERDEDVTEKVVGLLQRIMELTPPSGREQVRANARNHFGIEIG